ncbi:MAG: lamin tail domain-containing protein [Leeuwenhoekiella sp.]
MKKLLLGALFTLLLLPVWQVNAQTSLGRGDIAIIHAEGDVGNDDFAFVNFVELAPNTVIYFTDCGTFGPDGDSTASGNPTTSFNLPCDEGLIRYEAPSSGLAVGSVILFTRDSGFTRVVSEDNFGKNADSFDLTVDGDQIIAFQPKGSGDLGTDPRFIFLLNYSSNTTTFTGISTNDVTTDIPKRGSNNTLSTVSPNTSILSFGKSAAPDDEYDNVIYKGNYSFPSLAVAKEVLTTNSLTNYMRIDDNNNPIYSNPDFLDPGDMHGGVPGAKERLESVTELTFGTPIIITEFMVAQDGVTDENGEYIELYNTTANTINIQGYYLSDNSGEEVRILVPVSDEENLDIPPYSFFVLGVNMAPGSNGNVNVNYEYSHSDFELENLNSDAIILEDENGVFIDAVEYTPLGDVSWPQLEEGKAYVYIGLEQEDNNNGNLWAIADQKEGFGFTIGSGFGSPGEYGQEQYIGKYEDPTADPLVLNPQIENITIYDGFTWSPVVPSNTTTNMNALVVDGDVTFPTENVILKSLQVRSGATVNIPSGGSLKLSRSLTVRGDLRFRSDVSGNGELDEIPSSISYYGDVIAQAYYNAARSFSMITSSVTTAGGGETIRKNWQEGGLYPPEVTPGFGMHITGSFFSTPINTANGPNGFDVTTSQNPSMFYLKHDLQVFEPIASTKVALQAGYPYLAFVRGDRTINLQNQSSASPTTLRATGELLIGDIVDNRVAPNVDKSAFYGMFGNPYQATLNMNKVLGNAPYTNGDNLNIIKNQYYIYDALVDGDPSTTSVQGAYVTIMLPEGTATIEPSPGVTTDPLPGTSNGNEFLQPGQAFQVLLDMNVNTIAPSRIVFKESHKSVNQFVAIRSKYDDLFQTPVITGNLYLPEALAIGKNARDGFILQFDQNYSNEPSMREDSPKPLNSRENIGIKYNDQTFSIDRRAMPKAGDVVPLFVSNLKAKGYTYRLRVGKLDGDVTPVFIDNFTGIRTVLEEGVNLIDFAISADGASVAEDRFSLVFENSLGLSVENVLGTAVYPNPVAGDGLTITANKLIGKTVSIKMVDLVGRTVYADSLIFEEASLTLPTDGKMANGVYVLTISDGETTDAHRIIKQ